MRIVNLNPGSDIGASAWFVELDDCRLLMDAGMHPKRDGRAAMPLYAKVEREDLDAIAISHCHHDHVGSVPWPCAIFPRAHVLMTELSYCLIGRVLHNSVNVMLRQREEQGIRDYPLFTHDQVGGKRSPIPGFQIQPPHRMGRFAKARAGLRSPDLEFFDAGHAPGSAGILVRGKSQTLFYTGDVCFHDQTLQQAARFDGVQADVLIMETTRGNRLPPPGFTRAGEIERLTEAIQERPGPARLRFDAGLRPGAHPGNPRPPGPVDGGRPNSPPTDLHRRPGPGIHRDLRSKGPSGQPPAIRI